MKTRILPIAIAAYLFTTTSFALQPLTFTSYHRVSDHFVRAQSRLETNSNYELQFDQEFTSILIKISPHASLLNSYILVDKDTIRFKKDGLPRTPLQGSQLIVFRNPLTRLQFHSEDIQGTVEFHLYNSQINVVKVKDPMVNDHAKVSAETSLVATLVALDRKESLHRNTTALARHPDQYYKRKRRSL